MAKGGIKLNEYFDEILDEHDANDDDAETSFMNASEDDSASIHKQEEKLQQYTGGDLVSHREELKRSKVDAFAKEIEFISEGKWRRVPTIYTKFVLGKVGRTLYLKDGTKVTREKDPTQYLALSTLEKQIGVDYIRQFLFHGYKETQKQSLTPAQQFALTTLQKRLPAASENIELTDMPQPATEVDTAVKTLFTDAAVNTDSYPMRELLGLDKALQRTRGALVDNLAKLSQLDVDIAQEVRELEGEEAANDPEKKRRIQDLLQRLRDERASRLEAASVNREALRSQISRIRQTIKRVLNEDTTLAERLRTLFREQEITIASILTALGFIVSTIVLAIQNVFAGGVTPAPAPPSSGVGDWVKKQLKTLANWLKALAGKAAAALPGVISAIVSWLLKTAGSVAVWIAEHLLALAIALVAAAAVYLRDYRER